MTEWTSRYFTLAEMIRSDTAVRHGISNTPPPDILENLSKTAERMDQVRELLGHPIRVSSGYRGPKVNKIVGGSDTSAHSIGFAVDFVCPAFGSPLKVCEAIRDSGIRFDQLIMEFGAWTHIAFEPRMRQQVLTAKKVGKKTVYQPGL